MLKRFFSDLFRGWRRTAKRPVDPFEHVQALVASRQLDAAGAALDQARRACADDARGLFLAAEILRLRGAHSDALAAFRRALLADPRRVDAWVGLGDCSVRTGDILQACIYYHTALSLDPRRADVLNELGLIALARGNYSEAKEHFDQAVNLEPLHADAWNNFGIVATSRGDFDQARRCFHRAAHLGSGFYTALCNLGLACRDLGRLDEAADTLCRAAEAEPGKPAAWVNLAAVRQDQGRLDDARAAMAAAAAAAPEDRGVKTAHGVLLAKLGEAHAAESLLAQVLVEAPGDAEATLALAHLDLARGSFATGWDRYEARLSAAQSPRRRFPLPEWDGASPAGRRLLIYAEQGLGDTIMFASCLPDLMRLADGVVLHCEDRIWPLMQRSFPGIERYDPAMRDRVDAYAAIGSLPRLYRRRPEDFPQHAGYLQAAPEAQAQAAGRLRSFGGGLKAGIAWRGGLPATGSALRSLTLDELTPLLRVEGVEWVSLQYGDTDAELAAYADRTGICLRRLEGVEHDVDAAAAAIRALDLVVSVCSSIVHLGGALGKTTWVLTPRVPAWRYGLEGESMPWYPSVTLLRQTSPGEWDPVIQMVRERLSDVRG